MKKYFSTAKIIILALALGLGLSYAQADWSAPLSAPTTCTSGNPGCDAPINVSATDQVKTGGLTVKNLGITGTTLTTIKPLDPSRIYGSLTIKGSTGGFSGINFQDSTGANTGTFMSRADGYSGILDNTNNWRLLLPPPSVPWAIMLPGGSPAAGKVLTAIAPTGEATWQTPASVPTPAYQIESLTWPSGAYTTTPSAVIRMNTSTGALHVSIAQGVHPNYGSWQSYPIAQFPPTEITNGSYALSCNITYCCRLNTVTGVVKCYNFSTGNSLMGYGAQPIFP